MNIEQLREELKEDEGCKYEVYLDHLGLPTHGIGHLITEWDEEYEKPVGTPVSEERVNNCFQSDVHVTIDECKKLYDNFDDLPEEVQLILCNMMFNMGRPRLSKFLKLNDAIANENWLEASIQMEDSRWHKQVTNRANRLIKRMEAIGVTEQIAV
jgi:lysozyme|tara:strand:- start:327 stop:791 length:465 start_codon:yes stop_codon:yes gene_type:complete